jgi:hypothetical protein
MFAAYLARRTGRKSETNGHVGRFDLAERLSQETSVVLSGAGNHGIAAKPGPG